ncbi:MAG: hypothetical protein ACLQBD_29060 [Syntrophobacteraceae bacterium]
MCRPEISNTDIKEFVELLGKMRILLDAAYSDEMDRIQREADALNRNEALPPFEKV